MMETEKTQRPSRPEDMKDTKRAMPGYEVIGPRLMTIA